MQMIENRYLALCAILSKNYQTCSVKPALQANTASIISLQWRVRTRMLDIAYHFERMLTIVCLNYNTITTHIS